MEFNYRDLLPLEGPDTTEYRLVTTEGVNTVDLGGRQFLEVSNEALTALTSEAMRDIAHLLRPSHLQQLANILDDDSTASQSALRWFGEPNTWAANHTKAPDAGCRSRMRRHAINSPASSPTKSANAMAVSRASTSAGTWVARAT
jgi:hypothetical protein